MKAEDFDHLVRANGYKGKAISAARMVAVDGMTFEQAGKQSGCTKSAAHASLARVRAAYNRTYGQPD